MPEPTTPYPRTAIFAITNFGKSVVTSNKEMVAAKGAELLETAKEHKVNFFFEASVGDLILILALCAAYQLYLRVIAVAVLNVLKSYFSYSLRMNAVRINMLSERQRSELSAASESSAALIISGCARTA